MTTLACRNHGGRMNDRYHLPRSEPRGCSWALPPLLMAVLLVLPAHPVKSRVPHRGRPQVGAARAGTRPAAPTGVPAGWQARIEERIRRSEYEFAPEDGGFSAPNRRLGLRTIVAPPGVEVMPRAEGVPTFLLSLRLAAYGRRGSRRVPGPGRVTASERTATIDFGSIRERWINGETGIEQVFDVLARPEGEGGPLQIEVAVGGTLQFLPDGPTDVRLVNAQGKEVLRYAGLAAKDARGEALASRLGVRGGSLVLEIDDATADFPVTIDPLLTAPAWTVVGEQAFAEFGVSVSTAGDVNGDGYSDVIVGASLYDTGLIDAGRAYLFYGSASGLSTSPAWTAQGDRVLAHFGRPVCAAGDVNGDGYSDVVVSARNYTNDQSDEGRVFIYYGSAAGISATPDWTAEGNQPGAELGLQAATAGDVNGDGYGDVIVGARLYDNGEVDEGRVYLYYGSASGLSPTPGWSAEGNQAGAEFGWSVASAGDVNGDGYGDVIVGAPTYDNGEADEGRAYVYYGSAGGLSATPGMTAEGDQPGAQFGISVATAGDVNGDGYADVIVGAWYYDQDYVDEGRAYVYYGSASGLSPAPQWIVSGGQGESYLGWSVSTAGDVNGDGYADVIVGAWAYDNGELDEGAVFVYHGSPSGLSASPDWTAEADQASAKFGFSVATAGDVNGDGYSDVIIGSSRYDGAQVDVGAAFVYYGSAAGLARGPAWNVDGDQPFPEFGVSVASAGDVNGDGYSDIIIGAPLYDHGEVDEGRAYLFLGSASGPSATPAWIAEGDQAGANLGRPVASAGDVNGDGYDDVIVGARHFSNGESDEGRAYSYYGSPSGLAPSPSWTAESDQAGAEFGWSASGAGDVNGDGYADVIVGARLYDGAHQDEGRAYVYLGSPSGLAGAPAWTADGGQTVALFGWSVASAGDVNGDGFSDVVVGAPTFDGALTDEGRISVFFGSSAGLAGSAAWTAYGGQAGAELGISVATAGDVNGDGFSDVIAGAWFYDGAQPDEGAAFVFHGSPSGLSVAPDWSALGGQADAYFGWSVASAGDVNGDGFSDVVAGAWAYDNGQADEGAAFLYYGSAAGLAPSPGWTGEGDQVSAKYGYSVAAAGDVNGDGFGDVLVGSSRYDGAVTDQGRVFLYYGGGGGGLDRRPMQARADGSAPVALLGKSDSSGRFRLRLLGRSPAGRGRVRLEAEIKPLGQPFDGSGIHRSAWADTGPPGPAGSVFRGFDEVVDGLSEGPHRWRVRLAGADPFFPRSPWFALSGNAATETDLRISCQGALWFLDADGDGFGDPASHVAGCAPPTGFVGDGTDCDDSDPARFPGNPEICDGKDNDCDNRVDDLPAPSGIPALGLTASGDIAKLAWSAVAGADAYDVVRGGLGALHGAGGLTAATSACLANDRTVPSVDDPAGTPPGDGLWYLVRPVNCRVPGTYNEPGSGQMVDRDAAIGASASACP